MRQDDKEEDIWVECERFGLWSCERLLFVYIYYGAPWVLSDIAVRQCVFLKCRLLHKKCILKYLSVFLCTYTYLFIYLYLYMRVCGHESVCVCVNVYLHVYIYVLMYIYWCICTHIHLRLCIWMYTYTYTQSHTHIYINICIYTHINKCVCKVAIWHTKYSLALNKTKKSWAPTAVLLKTLEYTSKLGIEFTTTWCWICNDLKSVCAAAYIDWPCVRRVLHDFSHELAVSNEFAELARTRTNSQFRKIAFTNCQLMLCASSLERFLSIKYVATALCQLVCMWETTHSCIFLFMHVPRTRPRTCDTTRSSVRHDSVCLHLFVAVWVFISCAMENDRDVLLLVFTTYWVE